MLSAEERLRRWREYERARGRIGDAARVIIPQLEAEIAAQFSDEAIIPLTDYEKEIVAALKGDDNATR